MINWNKTELKQFGKRRYTCVWVVCDGCGVGRWVQRGNAKRTSEAALCRVCSNIHAWNGKRIDISDGYKHCSRCGEYKLIDEFTKDARKSIGVKANCKACSADMARQYRINNRDKYRANKRAEKARRRARVSNSGGDFTTKDWEYVLWFYAYKCLKCGTTNDLQPDHVIPLSKQGIHSIENIQPLCGKCNREKQAQIIDYRNGNNCYHASPA